jgi:hypothetical protein
MKLKFDSDLDYQLERIQCAKENACHEYKIPAAEKKIMVGIVPTANNSGLNAAGAKPPLG